MRIIVARRDCAVASVSLSHSVVTSSLISVAMFNVFILFIMSSSGSGLEIRFLIMSVFRCGELVLGSMDFEGGSGNYGIVDKYCR